MFISARLTLRFIKLLKRYIYDYNSKKICIEYMQERILKDDNWFVKGLVIIERTTYFQMYGQQILT